MVRWVKTGEEIDSWGETIEDYELENGLKVAIRYSDIEEACYYSVDENGYLNELETWTEEGLELYNICDKILKEIKKNLKERT